mmetsp:Transcript_34002/g.97811  ORF Transcript_34002/g.97811 Transcript_34002/m.97811 type:complete len:92 (+) Transcript_34002:124-399(+)
MPAKGAGMGETKQAKSGDGTNGTPKGSEGQLHSCISSNGEPRTRTDAQGVLIERGKPYKVCFIDEVKPGAAIQEVKEVKSFKNSSGCCAVM